MVSIALLIYILSFGSSWSLLFDFFEGRNICNRCGISLIVPVKVKKSNGKLKAEFIQQRQPKTLTR